MASFTCPSIRPPTPHSDCPTHSTLNRRTKRRLIWCAVKSWGIEKRAFFFVPFWRIIACIFFIVVFLLLLVDCGYSVFVEILRGLVGTTILWPTNTTSRDRGCGRMIVFNVVCGHLSSNWIVNIRIYTSFVFPSFHLNVERKIYSMPQWFEYKVRLVYLLDSVGKIVLQYDSRRRFLTREGYVTTKWKEQGNILETNSFGGYLLFPVLKCYFHLMIKSFENKDDGFHLAIQTVPNEFVSSFSLMVNYHQHLYLSFK